MKLEPDEWLCYELQSGACRIVRMRQTKTYRIANPDGSWRWGETMVHVRWLGPDHRAEIGEPKQDPETGISRLRVSLPGPATAPSGTK